MRTYAPINDLIASPTQGIVHPIVALIIWSDVAHSLSPYRFCVGMLPDYNCTLATPSFLRSMYVLDFAGSGAVHMLGNMRLLAEGLLVALVNVILG